MRTFGIIGYPLSHSFSQKYFTEKFEREKLSDCKFLTFPIEDMSNRDFYSLLEENPDLCGLSVTIPYKEKIIALLDEVDPIALFEVHAVNCIRVRHDKDFKGNKVNWSPLAFTEGDNTDTAGFENSLLPLLKPQHTKALILGSGGAAKAVSYVLRKLNIEHLIVTRNIIDLKDTRRKFDLLSRIKYQDVDRQIIDSHPLIINTTPLGMFPNINACPDIPYTRFMIHVTRYN